MSGVTGTDEHAQRDRLLDDQRFLEDEFVDAGASG
jgi:hypothetical protein